MSAQRPHSRVLLVEDNPLSQKVTKYILEGLNCEVDIAETGEAAVALFNDEHDLVFMDIGLPDMDGIEATQCIRKDTHGKTIPIVAMTAHVSKTDLQKYADISMNDVVTKPISLDGLQDILDKYLSDTLAEA